MQFKSAWERIFVGYVHGYSQRGSHSNFLSVIKLIFRNKCFWNVEIKIFPGKSNSDTQHGKLNPGAKIGVTEKLSFLIGRVFFVSSNSTNLHYNVPVQNVGLSVTS